jgi:segregation and condensation protein B
MAKPDLIQQLTAILFVANEPIHMDQLAGLTGQAAAVVEETLGQLNARLEPIGLRASQLDGRYELVTLPATDELIRQYLEGQAKTDLSKPALETLAILAYRGPLTRAQLDDIRGVASDMMLRNLMQRGLVGEQGKAKTPGRPALYGVSHAFLRHFGLASLQELPPLPSAQTPEQEAAA